MSLRPLLVLAAVVVVVVAALAALDAHRRKLANKPTAPLEFTQQTPAARLALKIDPAIGAAYPFLSDTLYRDGVRELKAFAAQAAEDQARLKAKGRQTGPFAKSISWSLAAATPRLLSLRQAWIDQTGGPPNHGWAVLFWEPVVERKVTREELLRPGADMARLDDALCRAFKARQASERSCPRWEDAEFVLEPSHTPGKAAGMVFLFEAGAVAPYEAGDLSVRVPAGDIRSELAPAYADLFAP